MLVPITVAFIFARQQHHHRSRTTAAHWAAQPPRRLHLPPPSWARKSPKHRSSTSRVAISPSSCVMGNNKLWVKMRNGLCTKHTTSTARWWTKPPPPPPPRRACAHTHTKSQPIHTTGRHGWTCSSYSHLQSSQCLSMHSFGGRSR